MRISCTCLGSELRFYAQIGVHRAVSLHVNFRLSYCTVRAWFEVGKIELPDTNEDVNTSRSVNVKYVRDDSGQGYPQ